MMSTSNKLLCHWKLQSSEYFDEYLKAAGVGIITRNLVNAMACYEEIIQDGEQWTINITSTFRSRTLKFKLGEEFREETIDGRTVMSVMSLDGEKLVQHQSALNECELNSVITREVLEDGRMLVTYVADGKNVTARRCFMRHYPC